MKKEIENTYQIAFENISREPNSILNDIRNYLAGQAIGITRDEALLDEVIKCVFCRVYIDPSVELRKELKESDPENIAIIYRETFLNIKEQFNDLFSSNDEILLAPNHISYINNKLSKLDFSSMTHDIIGDIYETFVGSALRGNEGQFFTPYVAVRTLIEITNPRTEDTILDPACGSGSFLIGACKNILKNGGELYKERIHGIDKDDYLIRLAKIHLALQFKNNFPIYCADSLTIEKNNKDFLESQTYRNFGKYTLILTNPPFGAKIVAIDSKEREFYDLAHKWRYHRKNNSYAKTNELLTNPPPQVLFLEKCISMLDDKGRLGIVLPESLLSSPKYRYVVQYILQNTKPIAIIGMPESLFKTSGKSGTHTKVCLVVLEKSVGSTNYEIFMAEAKWCGHDSRGKYIPKNDLPQITSNFFHSTEEFNNQSYKGFQITYDQIKDFVLAPRFYNPEPIRELEALENSHHLIRFSELVKRNIISISTGDEVGKLSYGTGNIPFIRTSDLSNWEIKIDPKHSVSEEIYKEFSKKQDIKEGDILMVKDGTYLIGTCAYVTKHDEKILYQSHLYKIRVHKNDLLDSYLLLAILSSKPVTSQILAKSYSQDIIESLGNKIQDLILPIPKSKDQNRRISELVKSSIENRIQARELTKEARKLVSNS